MAETEKPPKERTIFQRLSPIDQRLSDEDISSGYRWLVRDGVASQVMASLQSGAFMVAFILLLGGSNFYVGLMATIPFLTQFFQLPAVYLIERVRRRKTISFLTSFCSRGLWIPLAALPLVLPKSSALIWVVVLYFVSSCIVAVGACSWNSWMRDFIPSEKRGRLMSNRMRLQQGGAIVVSLAAGFALAYGKRLFPDFELQGYLLVFTVGTAAGLVGTYFLAKIPEPRMPVPTESFSFRKILAKPLRDENFRRLLWFLGSWSFAINLAAPFFTVYMLKRLGLPISWVVVMTAVSTLSNMLVLNIWGRLSDRFSNKSVLAVSGPLLVLSILAWPFTSLFEEHILTFLLLIPIHIFSGFSTAGVTLASGNIAMKLAPPGEATGYLVMNSLTGSLFSGVATLIGGTLAAFFASQELYFTLGYIDHNKGTDVSIPLMNLRELDFLFVLAVLIGLYAIYRLTRVEEEGEVEGEIVVKELFAEVTRGARDISTVGGPIGLSAFPFGRLMRFFNNSS